MLWVNIKASTEMNHWSAKHASKAKVDSCHHKTAKKVTKLIPALIWPSPTVARPFLFIVSCVRRKLAATLKLLTGEKALSWLPRKSSAWQGFIKMGALKENLSSKALASLVTHGALHRIELEILH